MPQTATVTGRVTDLTNTKRPGWQPLVRASLENGAVAYDGTVVGSEPVVLNSAGAGGSIGADLIISEEFPGRPRYLLTLDWLSPSGGTAIRELVAHLYVPRGGGGIGDLIGTLHPADTIYTGPDVVDESELTILQLNTTTWDLYERQ